MNILHVNKQDVVGGAARTAWGLCFAQGRRGHAVRMAVGTQYSNNPNVLSIPKIPVAAPRCAEACRRIDRWLKPLEGRVKGLWRIRHILRVLMQNLRERDLELGREDFNFPGCQELLFLPGFTPDVVHLHNLHADYFDLRILPTLSRAVPVFMTLHDEWLLTGHCACTFDCRRWEAGCGQCPNISIYPETRQDATAWNWKRKKQIYKRSRLYVATPSRWLMRRVEQSMLRPFEARVIPNGVNLQVFHAGQQEGARERMGLPLKAFISLYAADSAVNNPFKNYAVIAATVEKMGAERFVVEPCMFVTLGADVDSEERVGNVVLKHVRYVKDPAHMADYYRAANVFLHAARTDNFPNTVVEAQACGTPVIATAVGGIPEQIEEGVTGFLVPPGNSDAMSIHLKELMANPRRCVEMGRWAAEQAKHRFSSDRQAEDYLAWYDEVLNSLSRKSL